MTIGNVSIVGIYKGLIHPKLLKNNLEYWTEIGGHIKNVNNQDNEGFHYSDYPNLTDIDKQDSFYNEEESSVYHYVDLLAIVQNVQIMQKHD